MHGEVERKCPGSTRGHPPTRAPINEVITMPNKRLNSIKDKDRYETLRDKGLSKEKAARIANSPKHSTAVKCGRSAKYEE